jgi:hypothetical protein
LTTEYSQNAQNTQNKSCPLKFKGQLAEADTAEHGLYAIVDGAFIGNQGPGLYGDAVFL